MTETLTQQVVLPQYVWADELQRSAVGIAAVHALGETAKRHAVVIDGDPLDATVTVTPMQAQVGHANVSGNDVAFVAYEPCEPAQADLVWVAFTVPITKPTAS